MPSNQNSSNAKFSQAQMKLFEIIYNKIITSENNNAKLEFLHLLECQMNELFQGLHFQLGLQGN